MNLVATLAPSPSGLLITALRAASEHVGERRGLGTASPAVSAMLDRIESACARGMPEIEMLKRLVADLKAAIFEDNPPAPVPAHQMEWDSMEGAGE